MTETLDLSNVINISILSAPQTLGTPNINTAALISKEPKPAGWTATQEFAIYTNATEVANDFGSSSDAAAIAAKYFAQNPNPLSTGGYLAIVVRLNPGPIESIQDAIVRVLNKVFFFGVLVDEEIIEATFVSLTTFIQTLDKIFFYTSSDPADYQPDGLLDDLRTASKTHTRGLYYGEQVPAPNAPWLFSGAYAGRALSTNFAGSLTTTTMHLKQLATIVPDATIDQTELVAAGLAGVDIFVNIASIPALFTSGANTFFDEVYNELWFKFALQTAGFNYLAGTNSKIPQTESGMEGLKNVYRNVCQQGVENGFMAPGSWTSPDVFGNPEDLIRSVDDIGFYVFSIPVVKQLQADREARLAPLVQIAIKAAGAIHKSNVIVNVNL